MSQNQIIAVVARSSSLSPSSVGLSPVEAVRKRLHSRHSRHLRSNRRLHSRSSPNSVAAADVNLSVEVQGDDIVVTLPGTSYVVTYYRAAAFPQQLLTKSHSGREDEDAPMTQAEFHARAWKAASHKARALGWIV